MYVGTKMCNILTWGKSINQNLDFFLLLVPKFFLKTWVLIMGKAWKWDFITVIMGHFNTIFAPKMVALFFNLVCQNAVNI